MPTSYVDKGQGPCLVMIPGVQGRWEWLRPAVDALAEHLRVVTFSLSGEPGTEDMDEKAGFGVHVAQVDSILDRAGVHRAAICGVSYGGLIALRYAARRPSRVNALVLVSTPGPRWRPDERVEHWVSAPRRSVPAFVLGSPRRMLPEILAAHSGVLPGVTFSVRHLARILRAPFGPSLMAARLRQLAPEDFVADCQDIQAPTLIVTGEKALDRVVPVESTLEYRQLIRTSAAVTLERTGHIGLITRPTVFAALVAGFVLAQAREEAPVRGVNRGERDAR